MLEVHVLVADYSGSLLSLPAEGAETV